MRTAEVAFAHVTPRPLVFPRDHGAHPEYRTEWWYLTGWLDAPGATVARLPGDVLSRLRTTVAASASRFSPQQLVIAHAAIADPARGALLHDERVQRAGFGLVEASTDDTDVRLDRWRFVRDAVSGGYRGTIPARSFDLCVHARSPTQPLLLQGRDGFSQKGPQPEQASHYYSSRSLQCGRRCASTARPASTPVTAGSITNGRAACSMHEAAGWDWIGMNLDDGAALTAFRDPPDGARAGRSSRMRRCAPTADPPVRGVGDAVRFEPLSTWRSPAHRTRPIRWRSA